MKLGLKERIRKLIPLKQFPFLNYILIAILLLGFVIRVYKIDELPMYGDELTIVYDSYSLLKTGMDQTGEPYPLTFEMGEGRLGGYIYGSIPFVAIFGPSEWGVRGLSLFSSLGIILLIYFLGKKLFDKNVGLWASFLASVSIWDIYLSRAGFEAHFALFLALFGVVMFLYQKYIPMAFLWGLTIFTYPTFKLTLPLLFLVLIFYQGFNNVVKNKMFLLSIIILAIFASVSINESLKGLSEQRFLSINVFADSDLRERIIQEINERRNLTNIPEIIKPIIYNKPIAYTRILFENYIENLSPEFLFLRGDRNPRHNPAEMGTLFLIDLPLLFFGLYLLIKNERRKLLLIILWIMIVPLATMLLGQTHGLRNNLMLPAFLLISGYALSRINVRWKITAFILIITQLIYVLIIIYYFAPNKFGSFWSQRAKEVVNIINANKNQYQKIVVSNKIDNIGYAYPVYSKIEPSEVIKQRGTLNKYYDNIIIADSLKEFEKTDKVLIIEN